MISESKSPPARPGGETLLVVHADLRLSELLQMTLTNAGYDVCLASDPDEAQSLFRQRNPEVVIADLTLGLHEGRDLTEALRGQGTGRAVPLVLLSDDRSSEAISRILEIGAEDCLFRPFSPPELLLRIRRILERAADHKAILRAHVEAESRIQRMHRDLDASRLELREHRSALQAALDMQARLGSSTRLDDFTRKALMSVSGFLAVPAAGLFLKPRPESAWLEPSQWVGVDRERIIGLRFPASSEFLRVLSAAARPARIGQFDQIPGTSWEAGMLHAAGFTVVSPLVSRHEPLGFLGLSEREGGKTIGTAEMDVVAFLSSVMARGVEACRRGERDSGLALATVASLVDRMESRYPHLEGRTRRVVRLAAALGRHLRLSAPEMGDLRASATFHDAGLLVMSPGVLSKATGLTSEEWREVRDHPVAGAGLAREAGWPESVQSAVRHHHEAWIGTGYPGRLKHHDIPLNARIIAAAACYDAMIHARPYRPALAHEDVKRFLASESAKVLDPTVVEALLAVAAEQASVVPQDAHCT